MKGHNRLLLFREIISVYSENRTKHVNTLCGQNAECFNVKVHGTYNNRFTSKGK
jgi:hypothetical protein